MHFFLIYSLENLGTYRKNYFWVTFLGTITSIIQRIHPMDQLTDAVIIQKLQSSNPTDNNDAFFFLYDQMHPKFTAYLQKRGGKEVDAEDLLQEGLIVLYKMAKQNRLGDVKNIQSYFFTICKNFWLNQHRKLNREEEMNEFVNEIGEEPAVLDHLMEKERTQILDGILKTIGEDCRTVLILFYYERKSIKEILLETHYASEAAVKNKKSKCMKSLRELFQNSPELQKLIR